MARRFSLMMMLALVALGGAASAQDNANAACKIGRPFYCAKHAGSNCAATNTSRVAGACEAWRDGCIECHEAADACLGHARQLRSDPVCGRCEAAWGACMDRNMRRHWPRQS
jgi:hypothetical protein